MSGEKYCRKNGFFYDSFIVFTHFHLLWRHSEIKFNSSRTYFAKLVFCLFLQIAPDNFLLLCPKYESKYRKLSSLSTKNTIDVLMTQWLKKTCECVSIWWGARNSSDYHCFEPCRLPGNTTTTNWFPYMPAFVACHILELSMDKHLVHSSRVCALISVRFPFFPKFLHTKRLFWSLSCALVAFENLFE